MTWVAMLSAMVAPMVIRAIIALSFTVLTFTGVTELVGTMVTMAQSNWSALPVAVLQLCTLSGIPEVLGMIFGAYSARLTMWAATSMSRYVVKGT